MPEAYLIDTGTYKAVATNRAGTCQTTIRIRVQPKEMLSRPVSEDIFVREEAPKFTKVLRDVCMEPSGPRLSRLDCFIMGIPRPTVSWKFVDQPIMQTDHRFRITADRPLGAHSLTILQPGTSTAGTISKSVE